MSAPLAWMLTAALGLAVGSFLNVCIWRLPRVVLDSDEAGGDQRGLRAVGAWLGDVWHELGRSARALSYPPSACPACGTPIRWYHNVPVVSWIALGGRCAACGVRIAIRYPVVELATALLFVLHLAVFGWGPLLAVRLLFATALVVLFAIDLEHQLLPDVITVPGLVAGLVASAWLPPGPFDSVLGVALGGGALWGISEAYLRWRGVEGLGFGDVKMLAMIGAFLGWKGTLVTLLIGSFSGALLGVGLIAAGKGSMSLKLPFGTFLAVGALVASLWGDGLVAWYASLFPPVR
jgi:leader peptidase (prepilin peptidase)/N-methyltransferase